jgi:hypothetical protein
MSISIYEKKYFTTVTFDSSEGSVDKTGIVKEVYLVTNEMASEIKKDSVQCADIISISDDENEEDIKNI